MASISHIPRRQSDGHPAVEVLAGVLLGVLVGLMLVVLGQVDDARSVAITGGLLLGSLGLIRWSRSDR